jgi:hypothetical protein
MSTSQSSDNLKPRPRGDMYLRAEQRHRAELAAAELHEILTPPGSDLFQSVSRSVDTQPAAAAPSTLTPIHSTIIAVPAAGIRTAVANQSEPMPLVGAPQDMVPMSPSHAEQAATYDVPAVQPAIAARARRPTTQRAALVPILALAMIAVAATAGVVMSLSPGDGQPETAAVSGATTVPPAATAPVASAPVATASPSTPPRSTTSPSTTPRATASPSAVPAARSAGTAPARTPAPAAVRAAAPAPRAEAVRAAATAGSGGAARAAEGQLRITSTPAGARVTVNGIGWGETPVTVGHLPFGTKTVRLTRDGYASTQAVVTVSSDTPARNVNVVLQQRK